MDDSDVFDVSTSDSDISDVGADTGDTGFDAFDDITVDDIGEMLGEAEETGTDLGGETDVMSEVQDVSESELSGGKDIETGVSELSNGMTEDLSEAEKAADYARSLGFEKAGDYIENHYNGEIFDPSGPIPITTRNMSLDGTESKNGVPFEKQTVELTDGLTVEGVFPDFDSRHHVELGESANDMSVHQQFNACKEDFQLHMFDSPEKLEGLSLGDMEKLAETQGYTPEGYTWQHNPATGSFDLVSRADHSVGHTGGNALWGKK